MVRIAILGASFAGLEAAGELTRLFGSRAQVQVFDRAGRFVYRPSLPWVVFGQRRPQQITRSLAPLVAARGARFIQDQVEALEPAANTVWTASGRWQYDFLLIALGATSPPATPPHLEPHGFSPLWLDRALALRETVNHFRGGHVVVALCPFSPLTCAAYEYVFQFDQWLRRQGLRQRATLSLVTYEDAPLAWGGKTAGYITGRWLDQAGIAFFPSTFIERAAAGSVTLAGGRVLPVSLLIFVPPYAGNPVVQNIPRLTDGHGFVLAEYSMRSHAYPNIYAAGDAVAFPGAKTGHMAEVQGRIAARNIAAEFGLAQPAEYRSALFCLTDGGIGRGLLSVRKPAPQQGATRTYLVWPGWLPHVAKIGFEQYYLRLHLPR